MTFGVPKVDETRAFYREFGLSESSPGVFATADGGDQLRVVERAYRQLVEFVLSAQDADDVARIKANAEHADLAVTSNDDGSISVREPVVGIGARVAVRQAVKPKPYESPIMNTPGNIARPGSVPRRSSIRGPRSHATSATCSTRRPTSTRACASSRRCSASSSATCHRASSRSFGVRRIITTSASSARPSRSSTTRRGR